MQATIGEMLAAKAQATIQPKPVARTTVGKFDAALAEGVRIARINRRKEIDAAIKREREAAIKRENDRRAANAARLERIRKAKLRKKRDELIVEILACTDSKTSKNGVRYMQSKRGMWTKVNELQSMVFFLYL